jgi:hypothetical protein
MDITEFVRANRFLFDALRAAADAAGKTAHDQARADHDYAQLGTEIKAAIARHNLASDACKAGTRTVADLLWFDATDARYDAARVRQDVARHAAEVAEHDARATAFERAVLASISEPAAVGLDSTLDVVRRAADAARKEHRDAITQANERLTSARADFAAAMTAARVPGLDPADAARAARAAYEATLALHRTEAEHKIAHLRLALAMAEEEGGEWGAASQEPSPWDDVIAAED